MKKTLLISCLVYSLICAIQIFILLIGTFSWFHITAAFVLAIIPVPFFALCIYLLKSYETLSIKALILAPVWGLGVAAFASLIINTLIGSWVNITIVTTLTAPITEEFFKLAGLYLLMLLLPKETDSVIDVIIYGVLIGMGFALTENIFYYVKDSSMWSIFLSRGVLTGFAHPLFTGVMGAGVGAYMINHNKWFLALIPGGVILHILWNSAVLTGMLTLAYVVIFIPILIAFISIAMYSLKKPRSAS